VKHVEETCGVCTIAEANDLLSRMVAGIDTAMQEDGAPGTTRVTVRTDPPGASLVVDGKPAGTSPQDLDLAPGKHRIVASLDGHTPGVQEVALSPGSRQEQVDIALLARDARPQRFRTWKWVAAGGAAVALAAGIGLLTMDGDCIDAPMPPATTCRRRYNTVAAGSLLVGVGVLGAGASVYMFMKDARSSEPLPVTRRRVAVGASVSAAWLRIDF